MFLSGEESVLSGEGEEFVLSGEGEESVLSGEEPVLSGEGEESVLSGEEPVLSGEGCFSRVKSQHPVIHMPSIHLTMYQQIFLTLRLTNLYLKHLLKLNSAKPVLCQTGKTLKTSQHLSLIRSISYHQAQAFQVPSFPEKPIL